MIIYAEIETKRCKALKTSIAASHIVQRSRVSPTISWTEISLATHHKRSKTNPSEVSAAEDQFTLGHTPALLHESWHGYEESNIFLLLQML